MSPVRRRRDPARELAFRVLRAVSSAGAYANLELAAQRDRAGLSELDAAFATELVSGTCRFSGTYDRIIAVVTGRALADLDGGVLDALRLGAHQLLAMRVPDHAAVGSTVDLAGREVGERVTGLVNAVLRRVGARDLEGWIDVLAEGEDALGRLALATHHPRWIAEAFARVLPSPELAEALAANNLPPVTAVAVRPGLAEIGDLPGVTPARYSPFGGYVDGNPGAVAEVRDGRAGIQDEGSQLVALALSRVEAPPGPWLDLCAGPGGKAALLAGLAIGGGDRLVAAELQPHRARLVAQSLRAYSGGLRPIPLAADGSRPAWRGGTFARVMADVPCTGLGALRRRPEARWRRRPGDLDTLLPLQEALLRSAIEAAAPGGVVAYVTCSPHPQETRGIVEKVAATAGVDVLPAAQYLPEVPDAAAGDHVQLWPHRHGTDAMFLALLRRR